VTPGSRGNWDAEMTARWRCPSGDALDVHLPIVTIVAGGGHGVDVVLQRGLGDIGAGVTGGDRRQIELNVSGLRVFHVERSLGAVVGGGRSGVGIRVAAGVSWAWPTQTSRETEESESEVKPGANVESGFS